MYVGAITSARTTYGEIGEFPVTIDLPHGSALSPSHFALIMDELTTNNQEQAPW